MAGGKKKNCYRKTRKGKPFPGVQRYSKLSDQRIEEAAGTSQAVRNDGENEPTCVSSSRKKMKIQHDAEQPADASGDFEQDEYGLINVKHLSSVLSEIHSCEEGIINDLFIILV